MNSNVNLDKLAKRPIQYWFEDGIGELVTGGLLALIGLFFIIQQSILSPIINGLLSIFGVVLIGGGVILGRKLIGSLKERLVYPRTGYVNFPRRPNKLRLATAISITIALAITIIMLGSSSSALTWTPFVIALICSALMLYQAIKTGLNRLYIEAALSLLIGGVIALLGNEEMASSGLFFLIYGAVMVSAGCCTLWSYLKNAPLNTEQI